MFNVKKLIDDITHNEYVQKVQTGLKENPAAMLIGVAALVTSGAKLISAVGGARGSFAYAKDVKRRDKAAKK